MRHPKSLDTLVEHGIIEEVLRPLMSGKEAQVYLVVSEGRLCAAKIYKDAQHRSFKNRADYTEGRKVRNSRDQRAIAKRSKYGKGKDEESWKSTEVDMIYRLRDGGVRVPEPYTFIDGVLLMELVCDESGHPAPRLGDLEFSPEDAKHIFHRLLGEVVRMLCTGVVHGDFSEFNVLVASDGPVVIDFPQAVNAAGNLSARKLLIRDVENLQRFLAKWVPGSRRRPYAEEIWSLYEENRLTPESEITGRFQQKRGPVDTSEVLALIGDADRDENRRRLNAGEKPVGESPVAPTLFRRREVVIERPAARTGGGGPKRPTARSDANTRGAGARGPGASRPGGGPGRGGPRHDGGSRSRDERGYTRPEKKKSGPKRGDVVQNSTYVSPEARKLKAQVLSLTPRNESKSESASPSRTRDGGREGQNEGRARNNNRRRRGPASGAEQQAGEPRAQRPRNGEQRPGEQRAQRPRNGEQRAARSRSSDQRSDAPRNGTGRAPRTDAPQREPTREAAASGTGTSRRRTRNRNRSASGGRTEQ